MTGKRRLGGRTCPKCGHCIPSSARFYAVLVSLLIVTLAIVGSVSGHG